MPPRKKVTLARTLWAIFRPLLKLAAGLAVVLVGADAAVHLLVDFDAYKGDIAATVKRATGRELTIDGPVSVSLGFTPTLTLRQLTLASVPGTAKPYLATLERMELHVDLWSVLAKHWAIERLVLVHPDVALETEADGTNNWQMTPQPAAAGAAGAGAAADSAGTAPGAPAALPKVEARFEIGAIHVEGLHFAWRNGRTGRLAVWEAPRLDVRAEQIGGSMLLLGHLNSGGRNASVSGELGPLGRLLDPDATVPWQVDLKADMDGLRLGVHGTLARSWRRVEYQLQLDAAGNDLSVFAAMLPDPQPRLRDGLLSVSVRQAAGGQPELVGGTVHVAGLLVPSLWPDVTVDRADINAPALEQPLRGDVALRIADMPVHIAGSLGRLSAAMPAAKPVEPVPVELSAEAAGALVTVKGTLQAPARLAGLEASVFVRAANLATLTPLVHRNLPELKQIGIEGVIDGDLSEGGKFTLRHLTAAMPEGDLGGELAVSLASRPAISGTLSSNQFDIDGLLAALNTAPPASAAIAAPAPAAARPAQPSGPQGVLSGAPLNLSWLDRADLDLALAIATLHLDGLSYADAKTHLLLKDGRLVLDPFAADAPGGRLEGKLSVDSRAAEPPVAFSLHAPALSLPGLGSALGQPEAFGGTAFVDAALTASGRSPHALAASLDGHAGLAVADGDIDNAALAGLIGDVLKLAHVPESVVGGVGRTRLRCLAVRLEFAHGVANVATLTADSSRLLVEATGGANLGAETLALHVRPLVRTGPGLVVPVRIGGSFQNLKATLDTDLGGKAGVAGALAALAPNEKPGDACPAALAIAHGAAPAPVPAPAEAPAAPAKPPKLGDVLRNVLH